MTKEDLAFIRALRDQGVEVTFSKPDNTVPELQGGEVESNVNDFTITSEELSKHKDIYKSKIAGCDTGECLEQATKYFNKNIAPDLGVPNFWKIKESAGISSGAGHPRESDYGASADSWDIHAALQEKGAKQIYAPSFDESQLPHQMSEEEQKDFWKSMNIPVGSIVGMGAKGGTGGKYGIGSYNEALGLVPSNHSAVIAGYDSSGVPMIYDYGKLVPITNPTIAGYTVTNITAPKEVEKFTYDYLKENNQLQSDYSNFKIKLDESTEYDKDELLPFIDALEKNKSKFSNVFKFSNKDYDEFAKRAVATALAETGGGDDTTVRWKYGLPIPSYVTDKLGLGDTTGITQINPDVIFGNEKINNQLSSLGITKRNYDPWNPEHAAAASMALLKSNVPVQRTNIKTKGNKQDLSDAAIGYYQWVQPGLLKKGEAWGESEKVKKFLEAYDKISVDTPELQGGLVEATAADSSAVAANSQALLDYYKNYTLVDRYGNPLPQGSMFDPYAGSGTSSFRGLDIAAEYMKEELAGENRAKPKYPETYRSRMQGIGRFEGDTSFTYSDYRQDIDSNKFKQREVQRGIIDERAPMALYDRRIFPQGQVNFKNEIIDNQGNYDMLYDDIATVVMYDPIAVTPWNQLTQEQKKIRLDKYGTSGTPMDPNKIRTSSTKTRPLPYWIPQAMPSRLNTQSLSEQLISSSPDNTLTAIPKEDIIKDLPTLTPKPSPIKAETSFTAKGSPMIDAKNRTTTTVPEGEVWNEKKGWHRKMQEGAVENVPEVADKRSYAQILEDAEKARAANPINEKERQQEIEKFVTDLFASQKGSAQDQMQKLRDDPTSPFAYTPDADFSSIGYHLSEGNYGDAALYTAFAALPGAAGPVVNKVKQSPLFRGVYLNKEIMNLPIFKGKSEDQILDIMGTTIPGITGTPRKKQLNQTLNFGRDFDAAVEHIGKHTDPSSLQTIGNTKDFKSGTRYILEVEPDELPFLNADQQKELYEETLASWRRKNPSAGFILGSDAKNLDPEILKKYVDSEAFRTEGVNVLTGNFPQFVGIENTKIGKLSNATPITEKDYLEMLRERKTIPKINKSLLSPDLQKWIDNSMDELKSLRGELKEGGMERQKFSKEDLSFMRALRDRGVEVTFSKDGYRDNSPDRNNAVNIIDTKGTGRISMNNEDGTPIQNTQRVLAITDRGQKKVLESGNEYVLNGDKVLEIPMMQLGGSESNSISNLLDAQDAALANDADFQSYGNEADVNDMGGGSTSGFGMSDAMAIGAGVANITQSLAQLGPESSTEVGSVTSMGGSREQAVEGTIGGTLGSIPIVGQFYQIGSGIGKGFEAGANAFYEQGNETGGEAMTAIQGAIDPASQFGRNAELWEAGYLSDEEAALNFIGGFFGFGGGPMMDRRVRDIKANKMAGAISRSTGGLHATPTPSAESAGKFSKATGYPKPKRT